MNGNEIKMYVSKMIESVKDAHVGNEFDFTIEMADGSKAYVKGRLVKKFPVKRYYLRITADRYRLIKEKASKKELSVFLTELLNNLVYGE